MSRHRVLAFALAIGGVASLAAGAASASARTAYVTASEAIAVPVDLSTGTIGSGVPIPTEGSPPDVAITPDGSTAYVPNGFDAIVPIDVATDTAGPEIATGGSTCPDALAVKPDGTRLYSTNACDESVSVIDVATGTELTKVPVGEFPEGISITPDGARAYVSNNGGETVTPIDLTTNTPGTPIEVGPGPAGSAATPDGTGIYVTVSGEDAVRRIDVADDSVGPPIPVGEFPRQIAVTPDSSRAYVVGVNHPAIPIDLATGTPGTPIEAGGDYLEDVAVTPDGTRAWVTASSQVGGRLLPIDVPADSLGESITGLEQPRAIAIVPNQPPHAAFSSSPSPVLRGDPVSFDAGASYDNDGTVARYEWDFGDGGPPVIAVPDPQHTYAFGGTYTVTLTETDDEGCSVGIVFPGQTAMCNGSGVARVSHQVQVEPKCIEVTPGATSFVPRYRPARVVPGVRVRLAVSSPARLTVDAALRWSRGRGGKRKLKRIVANVQHWRRIRYVIPKKLRRKLPLGLPVKLRLRISAAPLDESLCPGAVVEKTLHVRVVKVIRGAVQHGRRR
jgi:YVTN family beta-propeller protein